MLDADEELKNYSTQHLNRKIYIEDLVYLYCGQAKSGEEVI